MQQISPLQKANTVPNFSTTDSEGNSFSKEILLGQKYLLYFILAITLPVVRHKLVDSGITIAFFKIRKLKSLVFREGVEKRMKISGKNFDYPFLYSLMSRIK